MGSLHPRDHATRNASARRRARWARTREPRGAPGAAARCDVGGGAHGRDAGVHLPVRVQDPGGHAAEDVSYDAALRSCRHGRTAPAASGDEAGSPFAPRRPLFAPSDCGNAPVLIASPQLSHVSSARLFPHPALHRRPQVKRQQRRRQGDVQVIGLRRPEHGSLAERESAKGAPAHGGDAPDDEAPEEVHASASSLDDARLREERGAEVVEAAQDAALAVGSKPRKPSDVECITAQVSGRGRSARGTAPVCGEMAAVVAKTANARAARVVSLQPAPRTPCRPPWWPSSSGKGETGRVGRVVSGGADDRARRGDDGGVAGTSNGDDRRTTAGGGAREARARRSRGGWRATRPARRDDAEDMATRREGRARRREGGDPRPYTARRHRARREDDRGCAIALGAAGVWAAADGAPRGGGRPVGTTAVSTSRDE